MYTVSSNAHGYWVIDEGAQTPMADGLSENAAYNLCNTLNALRNAVDFNLDTINSQQRYMRKLENVLHECRMYFDNRADAEMDTTSPHATPNREMQMLQMIDEARR
jgi:hypothetical protein